MRSQRSLSVEQVVHTHLQKGIKPGQQQFIADRHTNGLTEEALLGIAWTIVAVLDTWRIYGVSAGRWLLAGCLVLASSAVLAVIFWLNLRHYLPQAWRWAIAGIVGHALSAVVVIVQSALIRASLPH